MEDLELIQNRILKTYKKNIEFLESYDNQLFQRVSLLSAELEKNVLKENFSLEFSNDKFNILDLRKKKYLYTNDPYYDALYKVSRYYPNMQAAISLITTKRIEKIRDPKYLVDSFDYVNEYIDIINNNRVLENKKFKTVGKYIFIGTLLGVHIEKLHRKIKARNYLILEDSLEIFRLSLFFCDYKKIAKKSNVVFVVELESLDFRMILREFLKSDSQYNNILKYSLASIQSKQSLQKLTEIIALENPLLYSFSDYLGAYGRGIEYIKNEYKVLNFTEISGLFENKSVLYLGPGPSLSENIKFIKKAKNSFVVVCLASTLKLLSDNDIVPDIIISIDASTLIRKQFDVPRKYYKDSILIVSSKIDKKIVKKLNKENLFMVQDSIEFFEGFGILTGNSSGEIGYSLCCAFNVKELYFIGMDAALNQKTKSTHDKSYYINKEMKNDDYTFSDFGELDFDKDIVKVKGNFQDEVYTTRRYLQLIYNYNQVSKNRNSDMNVYNLSDGAYLEGIKPLKAKQINLDNKKELNKKSLRKNILKIFNQNSKNKFKKQEKYEMTEDKRVAMKLLVGIKKQEENECFIEKFNKIALKNSSSIIVQILNLYFDLLNPYINFLDDNKINTQQKLNMIQLEQIRKVLEFYKCKI